MTTNQTIDGVPRELLERIVSHCEFWHDHPYLEAIQGIDKELRALLDADKVNNRQMGLVQFVDAHPIKPVAKSQGEPVAWLGSGVPFARQQDAIEYASYKDNRVTALYAEQPAPVAVVLPERRAVSPARDQAMCANAWNACLDEVTRLNTK